MRASGASRGVESAIAALAGRQYGVVTRAQLVALGLSRGRIQRRVDGGRLLRVHPGVYAVGHRAPRRGARWMAAVLACGDGSLLSHRSAAALWQLIDREHGRPDVTAGSHRRTPGIAVHRGRLTAADRAVHQRIPVTSPARTLVDLAHDLTDDDLLRAVHEAQFRRLFHVPSMQEALARRPSRELQKLLDDIRPTQTRLEDRLLTICDRDNSPAPANQQRLDGHRVDFLWPAERVVVESDGGEAHQTPAAFQADRATTNALQLAGYAVLRFAHADLRRRAHHVADQIRGALERA